MAPGRSPLNCRASVLCYLICVLTLDATNNYESVGHYPAIRDDEDGFAIEYYQHRRLLNPRTWHVSDSGHLGFFFQRKFIGKRVPYCAFHTAQFNISLLVAHGDVHPLPGPRNDAPNKLQNANHGWPTSIAEVLWLTSTN